MTPKGSNTIALVEPSEPANSASRAVGGSNDFDPFNGGHSIPVFQWLLQIEGVTPVDALVYGVLAFYRGKGARRECWPSVKKVAAQLGIDERNCRRRIAKLERLRVIQRIGRQRDTNIFVFMDPGSVQPGSDLLLFPQCRAKAARNSRVKRTQKGRAKTARRSEEREEQVTEHRVVAASLAAEIERLEARYSNEELTKRAREGCELARRGGKMADTVWLRTLTTLADCTQVASEYAMREFAERHADGSKDERYMLAIARREHAKPSLSALPSPPPKTFEQRREEEVVCEY